MKNSRFISLAGVVILLAFAAGCARQEAPVAVDDAKLKVFRPLAEVASLKTGELSEQQITLGRMLFYEPRLSKSHTISCNSCHNLATYGVDNQPTSKGHKGLLGDRNSPTVYNSAFHFAQFWDGRAKDVEEQAKGPVMNPVEMAMPAEKEVVAVLMSMPEYVAAFKVAFPEEKNPVTFDNMAKAIGAFERKLVTPSRWDKFLAGDQTALSNAEKAGFNAFMEAGCQTCHNGSLLGGNMYQKLGSVKPYHDESDPGRAKVTENESDRMYFKVPSLRNVEMTAPYFHNGKIVSLEEAVEEMTEHQLGKQIAKQQVASIIAFLKALTGEVPADYIKEPELPKSTPATPKPEA
jgi:cytochrome c peroxidase